MRIAELLDLIDDFEREYGARPSRIYVSHSERRELYDDMIGHWMRPAPGERAMIDGVPIEFANGAADIAHLEDLVKEHIRVETASGINWDTMTRVLTAIPGLAPRATVIPSGPRRAHLIGADTAAAIRLLADDLLRLCPNWHHLATVEKLRRSEFERNGGYYGQRASMMWFDESATTGPEFINATTLSRQTLPSRSYNYTAEQFWVNPPMTQTAGRVRGRAPSLESLQQAAERLAAALPPPARVDFGLSGQWDAARYIYAPSPAGQPEIRLTDED